MSEILGLGITHYPNLAAQLNMSWRFAQCVEDPTLPEHFRNVARWHPTAREQWGDDQGRAHSDRHRQDMIDQFRKIRRELDAFEPDFVLIWGDDQYENFREDCVPAFSVLAYDSIEFQPWKDYRRGRNVWDEPADKVFNVKGHRAGGKYVASALLKEGIDVAYAYKPLHNPLGHAFANSVLFLDYDRKGFPYPLVPFAVNAYGRLDRSSRRTATCIGESRPSAFVSGRLRSSGPAAVALPSSGRCRRARVARESLARGDRRIVELEPCVSGGEE